VERGPSRENFISGPTAPFRNTVTPTEQIGYLLSGGLDLTIDGVRHEFSPGDTWCIPGSMDHSAFAVTEVMALEVFTPLREEYLPEAGESA
jgi:quercetin dioxygenase-like cupin family protein